MYRYFILALVLAVLARTTYYWNKERISDKVDSYVIPQYKLYVQMHDVDSSFLSRFSESLGSYSRYYLALDPLYYANILDSFARIHDSLGGMIQSNLPPSKPAICGTYFTAISAYSDSVGRVEKSLADVDLADPRSTWQ